MNKVFMIGRLASDVELRQTQTGLAVANYRLAVNRRTKGADGQTQADFFPCIAWDKSAEFASKYLAKGRRIGIAGYLQTRSYDAPDGSKRYITEIVVMEHEFCDSLNAAGGGYQEQSAPAPEPPSGYTGGGFTQVEDDELPF